MGFGAFFDVSLYELFFEIAYELAVGDALLACVSICWCGESGGVRTGERSSSCLVYPKGSVCCLVSSMGLPLRVV
jgi:hypothetical protein